MSAWIKLLFGLLLILTGLYLIVPVGVGFMGIASGAWLGAFVTVLKGGIPPFIILVGLLIAWIEWEEIRAGPMQTPEEAAE